MSILRALLRGSFSWRILLAALGVYVSLVSANAQLVDNTKATSTIKPGINKSLTDEIGADRGDLFTVNSSLFIINRDPFRAIRRGRQLFQRKFTRVEGQGPNNSDGTGDINTNDGIGAGLSDSCAGCHGRPRGAAGSGGDVATRPDSRDAPQLFGLGLKEMLADEITTDLRLIRSTALAKAKASGHPVTLPLVSKGIQYGSITAYPTGTLDTSAVVGVNADLRVRPFAAHGKTISIREFVVGALHNELGMEAADPDTLAASQGETITTPSGMVLDGKLDSIEAPPIISNSQDGDGDGVVNEVPTSLVDYFEFYLLNYFKPASYQQTATTAKGRELFKKIGCESCHMGDLWIEHDRRVADVNTVYDTQNGIFNSLFSTATALISTHNDGSPYPSLKRPLGNPFLVHDIYSDFKRHDLGPNFHERNYDGTMNTMFMTSPLWGIANTGPYGHDGRSINLDQVILRHGGEAQASRDAYAALSENQSAAVASFLNSLVLFPPDDTASNLDPGNRDDPNFPQSGHGSIKLTVLFNDPHDPE